MQTKSSKKSPASPTAKPQTAKADPGPLAQGSDASTPPKKSGDEPAAKPDPAPGEHCVVPYNPAGSTGAAPQSSLDAKLRALEAHVVARRGKVIQGQIELAELAESIRRLHEEAESKLGQLRASYRRKSEDMTDEKARLEAEEALIKALGE